MSLRVYLDFGRLETYCKCRANDVHVRLAPCRLDEWQHLTVPHVRRFKLAFKFFNLYVFFSYDSWLEYVWLTHNNLFLRTANEIAKKKKKGSKIFRFPFALFFLRFFSSKTGGTFFFLAHFWPSTPHERPHTDNEHANTKFSSCINFLARLVHVCIHTSRYLIT